MAFRSSRYPSIRSMSVSELLLHFRSSIDREALIALEERDADWSRENDALRAHCRTLDVESRELLHKTQWLEEELNEQSCMRKSLEEDIHRLAEKERCSQRKVRGLEMDVSDLRRAKNEELVRVRNEKADLEAKQEGLVRTIDLLKKERGDFQHALKRVKSEKNDQIGRVLNDRTRAEKQRTGRIPELLRRIQVLEREKKELQAEVCNVKREKSDEIRRISNSKMALEAEKRRSEEKDKMKVQELNLKVEALEKERSTEILLMRKMEGEVRALKDKSSRLAHNIDVLKREKREMEVEFRKTESAKNTEIEMILNEKMTLEVLNRRIEEAMKEKISALATKNEVLEMEKGEIEAQLCQALHQKTALGGHKSRIEAELKDKISELVSRIGVLEKEKGEKEAEFLKTIREKNTDFGRIKKEKIALEVEKRRAEECVKVLEKGKTALGDEFSKYKNERRLAMKEKDKLIKKITQEKTTSEAEVRKAEEESVEKISEFVKRTEVLVREKDDMEAEFLKTDGDLERKKEAMDAKVKEKSEEISIILKEKMDIEDEKRTMEDEHKKKVLELFQIIEVLKREKMVNSEEIKRILKEKMDLEAEIRTLKEEDEKKIAELADRIGILEREKRELDTEIMQKGEVIQVLAQENDSLEDMKKKLKMEINGLASKLKKDVKLFQPVHHPSNVDMLRTPLQNEGQKSLGGCKRKCINENACTHKRHLSEDLSGARISDIGNASSGGDIQDVSMNLASCRRRMPTLWKADQDLLDAFDGDPELCLEAICALYRQHKLLLSSKPTNTPLSLGARGFKPDYSSKVIALAEYLIDEDPDGRMKKSVAELEQLEPVAVGECIDIAKQHYKQVFEIYKNKDDPFFLS